MDTITAPQAAEQLGTSLPTVHRLLDELGVPRPGRGHPRAVTTEQLTQMRQAIGATPDLPAGLDRIELLVLTALARAALGLESERAVARAAGVSPTAAGRALETLVERGYVTRRSRTVVRGAPIALDFWVATDEVDRDPAVQRAIRTAETPVRAPAHQPAKRVPARFAHLFWNADLGVVDPRTHGAYVAQRLLEAGDTDALVWALDHLDPRDIRAAAAIRGTAPETKVFTSNALRRCVLDASTLRMITPTTLVAGVPVAGIPDLLAMKLKVIGDRGQLRDYVDVMTIEQRTDFTAERGFAFYLDKYRPRVPEASVKHILLALGYLEDVADDPYLDGVVSREDVEGYWHRRQPEIARALATFGSPPRQAPLHPHE